MKIKAVCETTKLSDRTIRYYIEQELITPNYTENYLGRRTYDFSEKDIKELNNIATLRKFDFSITEIRDIISSPEKSKDIIEKVKTRISDAIAESKEKLSVLVRLDIEKTYTVSELAEQLIVHSADMPMPKETYKRNLVKTILRILKSVITLIIVWLPILLSLFIFVLRHGKYEYPHYNSSPKVYIILLLSLLPSVSLLILSKLNFSPKKTIKRFLLVLCVLSLPFCFIMPITTITHSETTDFRYYRDFDAECIANRSSLFQELFPLWPHTFEGIEQSDGSIKTVDLDSRYYYRYLEGMDYTYDIYAEWPLEKEDFDKEVSRVKTLFEENKPSENSSYDYVTTKTDNYTCLFLYDTFGGEEIFEKAKSSYTYYIFAYNEKDSRVRYIFCESLESGVDQPYYLQLDW